MPKTPAVNTLYYGDNLDILRKYIEDESVDLVYLDPPFNSNATYNVQFIAYSASEWRAGGKSSYFLTLASSRDGVIWLIRHTRATDACVITVFG